MESCRTCQSCHFCHRERKSNLLEGASEDVVDAFEQSHTSRRYKRGDILYHQGSPGDSLYCVSSGRIKICRTDASGLSQILRVAVPGDFFGFRRVLEQLATSSAEAMEESVVCQIPATSVMTALTSDPRVALNILKAQSQTLERTEARVMHLLALSSRARVARLLLDANSHHGQLAPLTREEVAQLTGTAVETVSRSLHEMAREGLIRLRGRSIQLLDREGLERRVAEEEAS